MSYEKVLCLDYGDSYMSSISVYIYQISNFIKNDRILMYENHTSVKLNQEKNYNQNFPEIKELHLHIKRIHWVFGIIDLKI